MKLHSKLRAVALILAVAALAAACARVPAPVPTPIDIVIPTPTPKPAIAGEDMGGGLTDISKPLSAALATDSFSNAIFCGENTLLVLASGADDCLLAHYDIMTASLTDSVRLPFSNMSLSRYAMNGMITPLSTGGAAVIDPDSRDVIIYDASLTEITRYPDVAPIMNEDEYWVSIAYSESENALVYSRTTVRGTVSKLSLSDGVETAIYTAPETDSVTDLYLTRDGKLARIATRVTDYELPENRDNYRTSLVVDMQGNTVSETWLTAIPYSEGGNRAINTFFHFYSDFDINGKRLKLDYIEENDSAALNFGCGTAVTVMELGLSERGSGIVLSAYDIATGTLASRTVIEPNSWIGLFRNLFNGAVLSCDSVTGSACLTYNADDNGYSSTRTLIWEPQAGEIQPMGDWASVATPRYDMAEGETAASIEARIESRYDVDVYYGDAVAAYDAEMSLDPIEAISYHEGYDERFVMECLTSLESALDEYPAGMIDKISASENGRLGFFLCSRLANSTVDFEICGNYSPFWNRQLIMMLMPADSTLAFERSGMSDGFRSIIHHELCHAMQQSIFLIYDKPGAYTYEDWTSYWPEDFNSGDSSDDKYQYIYGEPEDVYFVDEYSTSNVLEDMSRLFEYAMWEPCNEQLAYPHINARLGYLCRLIRLAFDDGTWPEEMFWERAVDPANK